MWTRIVAAAAALGGLYLWHKHAEAAAATVPAGTNYLAVVTDSATIKECQIIVAAMVAQSGTTLGLTPDAYGAAEADGAISARWTNVLAAVQRYLNAAEAAKIAQPGYVSPKPVGFPAMLRTDGVLDYATAVILINA